MHRAGSRLTIVAAALTLGWGSACRTRSDGGATFAVAPVGPPGFSHKTPAHEQIGCARCHDPAEVAAARPARPGKDHAPCDDAGCHQAAFMALPGPICQVCHARVVVDRPGESPLAPYPSPSGVRSRPSAFSHTVHLDRERLDRRLGFHVACNDCHERAPEADDHAAPGHGACLRCHGETGQAPRITDCVGCHVRSLAPVGRERSLVRGDVHFRHQNHETDRRGRAVSCVTCHAGIAQKRGPADDVTPTTQVCVDCHDDERRTPEAFAVRRCEVCHTEAQSGALSLVAPRSHLPPRDRPDSHTLAFRQDHAADARREPAACAGCHGELSGGSDGCDECHQVMKPRDHSITFSEQHGPETSADVTRCAQCHAGDFCTTCHARAPRSHLPLSQFRQHHGEPARADMKACVTCHRPEVDCAGCHPEAAP